jgi:hypothetical protein
MQMAEESSTARDFIQIRGLEFNLLDDKEYGPVFQTIVSTILEEYKTLRAESLQISSLMITILQMGVAVAGVLFGAAAVALGNGSDEVRNLAFHMFYIVIPYFIFFIGILWSGEAYRYKRVGDYISIIETKIEILFRKVYQKSNMPIAWINIQKQIENKLKIGYSDVELIKPLAWEQWLKSAKRSSPTSYSGHVPMIYAFRIGFWLLIAFISPFVGYVLSESYDKYKGYSAYGLVSMVFSIFIIAIFYRILTKVNVDTDKISVIYTDD